MEACADLVPTSLPIASGTATDIQYAGADDLPASCSTKLLQDQTWQPGDNAHELDSRLAEISSSSSSDVPSSGLSPVDSIASFLAEGHQTSHRDEIFSEIFCERPGCRKFFEFNVHVPHKRYCGDECYDSVRLTRKRLLHWHRLTACRFAWEIYRLLDGKRSAPG